MAIEAVIFKCDWPNCPASLYCAGNYSDHNWESRDGLDGAGRPSRIVCPEHRFRTGRELDAAIEAEWNRTTFVEA
jgi:hypothetical protein